MANQLQEQKSLRKRKIEQETHKKKRLKKFDHLQDNPEWATVNCPMEVERSSTSTPGPDQSSACYNSVMSSLGFQMLKIQHH
jgi:hypothetical protein